MQKYEKELISRDYYLSPWNVYVNVLYRAVFLSLHAAVLTSD